MTEDAMTNERRAELLRAMEGQPDDQAVLFIVGWGAPEITCGEMRELLITSIPICADSDEDVDDCHCLDYDQDDEADLRRKCEQEERD